MARNLSSIFLIALQRTLALVEIVNIIRYANDKMCDITLRHERL